MKPRTWRWNLSRTSPGASSGVWSTSGAHRRRAPMQHRHRHRGTETEPGQVEARRCPPRSHRLDRPGEGAAVWCAPRQGCRRATPGEVRDHQRADRAPAPRTTSRSSPPSRESRGRAPAAGPLRRRGSARVPPRVGRQSARRAAPCDGYPGAGVDLGALQAAAVVDVDRLPLGELVEHVAAGLAVAVAGVLGAAEGQLDLGADGRRVDVDDARTRARGWRGRRGGGRWCRCSG